MEKGNLLKPFYFQLCELLRANASIVNIIPLFKIYIIFL